MSDLWPIGTPVTWAGGSYDHDHYQLQTKCDPMRAWVLQAILPIAVAAVLLACSVDIGDCQTASVLIDSLLASSKIVTSATLQDVISTAFSEVGLCSVSQLSEVVQPSTLCGTVCAGARYSTRDFQSSVVHRRERSCQPSCALRAPATGPAPQKNAGKTIRIPDFDSCSGRGRSISSKRPWGGDKASD